MKEQINTQEYWNGRWADKKLAGGYGQNQYYFLVNHLPKDENFSCLDLGCGRGAGISWLGQKFPKGLFFGIDFSDFAIKIANEKFRLAGNLFFKSGDVYKTDFLHSFDYILMIELLEHLRWPNKILEKFLKICSKAIFISIPSTNWNCPEHIYAYGARKNPFENFGAELLGDFDGRKKLKIEV